MIRIAVRAHPGARAERLELLPDGGLAVHVRAPALDGRANAAVLQTVAAALSLRPRQVRLLRGERARQKLIEIDLPDADVLRQRLTVAAAGKTG